MMRSKYCYCFKTPQGYEEIILDLDLLEAVSYAAIHGTNNPDVSCQKIIDRDLREVCVFRGEGFGNNENRVRR